MKLAVEKLCLILLLLTSTLLCGASARNNLFFSGNRAAIRVTMRATKCALSDCHDSAACNQFCLQQFRTKGGCTHSLLGSECCCN